MPVLQFYPSSIVPSHSSSRSQMPLGILRAVQDADDFQRIAQIPEEDDMRPAAALEIAGPNVNFLLRLSPDASAQQVSRNSCT